MYQPLSVLIDFIHHTQKERGAAALFLRHGAIANLGDLQSQFARADVAAQELCSAFPAAISRTGGSFDGLEELASLREKIKAHQMEATEVIRHYTDKLVAPAFQLLEREVIASASNNPVKVSAFVHFMQWKERVGLERAMGTQLLAAKECHNPELLARIQHLIKEQAAYERMFLGLADPTQKNAYEKIKDSGSAFKVVAEINDALHAGQVDDVASTYLPSDWIALFTTKMDLLQEAACFMVKHLGDESSSIIAASASHTIAESDLKIIGDMPMFAGVEADVLNTLLIHARTVKFTKGQIILMQGEPVSRLYIILDGWAKVFKSTPDGQELVLNILGRGEAIMETAVAGSIDCLANVQAASKIRLLSIPASALLDCLGTNRTMAANILSSAAIQSQNLISQMEQLMLRDAMQRVGWFMLRLYLTAGQKGTHIDLPLDKALIASYLGIKPETFSRTLQNFRDKGFVIQQRSIVMPTAHALCEYCTYELAQSCPRVGTGECSNHCKKPSVGKGFEAAS